MAPEVGTVRHGLVVDLQDVIVHVESICKGRACRCVKSGKIHDLRLFFCREKIPKADLLRRADHAVGFHAAELGILDDDRLALTVPFDDGAGAGYGDLHAGGKIASAADDVLDLAVSDVHLADTELIRIGVRKDFQDLSDDHLVKTACQFFHAFHLDRIHGEVIGKFLQFDIFREVNIIPDPI